jgi:DNA-binding transcriptional MocR family regulator
MKANEIAERRTMVAQLILAHMSVRQMAAHLNVSPATVQKDINVLRREWQQQRLEAMDQAGAEELQRLIAIERLLWPLIFGRTHDLQALDRLFKVYERRAKLLGTDAPTRIEHLLTQEAERLAADLGLNVADLIADAEAILAGRD